jgi:hypothetical protein
MNTTQPAIESKEITVDELRGLLRPGSAPLYAILDACDEPRVPAKVKELGPERAVSLYRGWAERDMWAIAPYLVQVDTQLFQWILDSLWQSPWGLFAVAPTDLATLRTHFRRFLTVQDPKGEQMYFRFYDPRVLPQFLKTCDRNDVREIFGPVESFVAPSGKSTCTRITLPNDR